MCERFGLLPAGVKIKFEDNMPLIQARLISYDQIRSIEETGNLDDHKNTRPVRRYKV